MTKDKELKLALEALEEYTNVVTSVNDPNSWVTVADGGKPAREAITALRERLAQPEQEPFGYFRYDPRLDAWVQNREGRSGTPFYTAPPSNSLNSIKSSNTLDAQRKPLTDEQWQVIADTLGCLITRKQKDAIEAVIGIKE